MINYMSRICKRFPYVAKIKYLIFLIHDLMKISIKISHGKDNLLKDSINQYHARKLKINSYTYKLLQLCKRNHPHPNGLSHRSSLFPVY